MADNGLAAVHHMHWQPMATAPKDKPIIIAVWDQDGPYYYHTIGWWEDGYYDTPAHWSHELAGIGRRVEMYWAELPPHPPEPEDFEVYGHSYGVA
jgi:hypothetical protein